jgi:hypothetical protein
MATGVEVAGFILAAIPLVISAIEHYRDGLDPLIEYSHYDRTLKGLRTRLRIQHNLFEGTLTRLLISDLSPSEAQSILAAIDAPYQTSLWRNPEIERQLQRRLGKQYETFMDVVCEMDAVMKKLMDKLDIDMQGKVSILYAKVVFCVTDYLSSRNGFIQLSLLPIPVSAKLVLSGNGGRYDGHSISAKERSS